MRKIFTLFILFLFICTGYGQEHIKSIFDCIFQADGTPTIRIETNWNKLINQKEDEAYLPGKVWMPGSNGTLDSFDVKVRARGMMRKQVCFFPPIKIDFKRSQLLKKSLDTSINKLKVVFQCRTGTVNDEYLLKEELCYDLYRVIVPEVNLRVKQVKYDCVDNGKPKYDLDGLIVEDEKVLAERYKGKVIGVGRLMIPSLEKDIYQRMAVFQYMIANTDWSIPNKHNIEMIKVPNYPRIVPIAYDFDYAGLVGTSYAVPFETLPIKSIFERYFMGHGVTEEDALALGKYFLSKKPDIIKAVDDFTPLTEKGRAGVKKFLSPFFDILDNEKDIKRTFAQK